MNQISNAIGKGLVLLLLLGLALYITYDIMLAEGRSLAQLYLYMAIGAFLLGAMASRTAFFVCLITTGYIDFFKRLMAAFGSPQPEDLYYILGIPPLLIAGAVTSILIQFLIGKREFRAFHFWTLLGSSFLMGLAFAQAIVNSGYRALGDAVNQGAYAFLFFLIPELLPNVEDRKKIFRWMVIIFTGVSIYMLRHHFFGLADFEYDYLQSGLTIESRVLWENEGALRGFSTMAGASVVSVFCSIMILVVMVPMNRGLHRAGFMSWIGRCILACLYLYAAWATVSRGGWICGAAAIGIYWFLKNRTTANLGYFAATLALTSLIAFAPLMEKEGALSIVEEKIGELVGESDNVYTRRAIVMGTATDRLKGWANLTTNPEVWTPFGLQHAGVKFDPSTDVIEYGHDFVIEFLVRFGYIPLSVVASIGVILLVKIDKVYFSTQAGSEERKICRLAMAVAGGIFVGGLGNGAQLGVYPQNFYFYLSLAIVLTSYANTKRIQRISAGVVETPLLVAEANRPLNA